MVKMINLTPETINFIDANGEVVMTVEPSGRVASVKHDAINIGEVNGVPVVETTYFDVENLPEETEGTIFIVTSIVAEIDTQREVRFDLYIPDEPVRDSEERVIGYRSLRHII